MAAPDWRDKLVATLGREQAVVNREELGCYRYDAGAGALFGDYSPEAAVMVKRVEDVQKTLAIAREAKVPVIPRGAATGQAGGAMAPTGGIILDFTGWNTIEKIYPEDYQVWLRPGVTYRELCKALAPFGLYLPPDPSSGSACTLGGMVANNAAGQRSLKYGPIGNYVKGLEVVLATGEVVTLGGRFSRVLKNASGLDLGAGLFVGSEGVLGVITGIRLAVVPVPPARAGLFYLSSCRREIPLLIRKLYEAKVIPSACEFVMVQPAAQPGVAEKLRDFIVSSPLEMLLLLEFEGNPAGVAWEMEAAREVLAGFKGTVRAGENTEEMQDLWLLLDEAEGWVMGIRPGARRIPAGEDVVVPPSRLVEALEGIQGLVDEAKVACINFGHAAFGNIHTGLLVKVEDAEEMGRVRRLIDAIHRLALSLNGATTGEHGTGIVRRHLLEEEHGKAAEVMKRVKHLLDPDNILNPGKIFP